MTSNTNTLKLKAFHLDLRIQVMTLKALKKFVDDISTLGLNALVMEYEATYPYKKHPLLNNQYSYTEKEIKDFLNHCQKKNIEVIPLQQCFGHIEYILRHEKYAYLRENKDEISQVCPLKTKEAEELFDDLFSELIQNHTSQYFHIGGDETYLLGNCSACKTKVEKSSKSKLYVDYVKLICKIVKKYGKTPVLWADIILKHQGAAKDLPKDAIFIDWNYGWQHDNFGNVQPLQKQGFQFWGAPALRSSPDNYYLTRWPVHFNNIAEFIPHARKQNYSGMIMTSWSTSGLYSIIFDQGHEVIDEPIAFRHVYPLNGFRILLVAYAFAIETERPLDTRKFILEYAQNRFGITINDAKKIWYFLNDSQELVWHGVKRDIGNIPAQLKKTNAHIKSLQNLKPIRQTKHYVEIEHFILMLKIRSFYLSRCLVEKQLTDKATEKTTKLIARPLLNLQKDAKAISKEFTRLQKDFLHPEEIKYENEYRTRKLDMLIKRIYKKR